MTETVAPRTPSRRRLWWGWATLSGIAVALVAISVPLNAQFYQVPVAVGLVLAVLHTGSILTAPLWPTVAVAVSSGTSLFLGFFASAAHGQLWPMTVTTIITQLAVIAVLGLRAAPRYGLIAWALPAAISIVQIGISPDRYDELGLANTSIIVYLSNGAFVLAVTLLIAQRARIRAQLDRERQVNEAEHERLKVVEERTRIARELHDVVAHGLSLIQVQASTAKYRLPELAKDASDEFDQISASARSSMGEMRRLLSLLRDERAAAEVAPQPGLADLTELADAARSAGISIELVTACPVDNLPQTTSLAAYRIIQEALSNAAKHAPGSSVSARIERDASSVRLTVENGAASEPVPDDIERGGYGITGMIERAALLGGTIEHGPTAAGGYRVVAVLPAPQPHPKGNPA